jgi:hypothetical protein
MVLKPPIPGGIIPHLFYFGEAHQRIMAFRVSGAKKNLLATEHMESTEFFMFFSLCPL